MNCKSLYLIFLMVSFCFIGNPNSLNCQEILPQDESNTIPSNPPGFTHTEVLLIGGLPYLSTMAMSLSNGLIPSPYGTFISAGLITLGDIPHVLVDPLGGLGLMGASGAAFAAGIGFSSLNDVYGDSTLNDALIVLGLDLSFWSFYEGYAKAREMAKPNEYSTNFKKVNFESLLIAPWQIDYISQVSVWLPTLLSAAAFFGVSYIENGDESAIWKTGRAYIGNHEVPIALGMFSTFAVALLSRTVVGIGEEAVYRGIGYEEMKINLGIVPATVIDPLLFSGVHISQEIKAGLPATSILLNYALRALITLGLDWAYNEGGLRASVAQHMWIDVFAVVIGYFCQQGVPQNSLTLYVTF